MAGQEPKVERVNVALNNDAAESLRKLVARTGMTKVDIVSRAIQVFDFLDEELRMGNEIFLHGEGDPVMVKIIR